MSFAFDSQEVPPRTLRLGSSCRHKSLPKRGVAFINQTRLLGKTISTFDVGWHQDRLALRYELRAEVHRNPLRRESPGQTLDTAERLTKAYEQAHLRTQSPDHSRTGNRSVRLHSIGHNHTLQSVRMDAQRLSQSQHPFHPHIRYARRRQVIAQ